MSGLVSGCAPGPPPRTNLTFEDPRKIESARPEEAYAMYQEIMNANKGKNDELAAQALLEAATFASDPKRFGSTEALHIDGELKAHEAYKQLLQQFPTSKAAQTVRTQNLQTSLETRIDSRNSKQFGYKLVDGLVGITGRHSAFSYWFALLLIAVIVKAITFPVQLKMYKSQREMQRIQPILKEIDTKYKGKPELNEMKMKAMQEHGVNPAASCLPLLIQMPFLFWVYSVIRQYEYHFSYGTFAWINPVTARLSPGNIGTDLAHFDVPLLVIYAISNYLTMKLNPPTDPSMASQQQTMSVMTTGMMLVFFFQWRFPAAFTFYWLMSNVLNTWQQYVYIYKPNRLAAANGDVIVLPSATKLTGNRSSGDNGKNGDARSNGASGNGTVRKSGSVGTSGAKPPVYPGTSRPKRKKK